MRIHRSRTAQSRMVTDTQLVARLHQIILSSDQRTITAASVCRRLEAELGVDLSGRRMFIVAEMDKFVNGHDAVNEFVFGQEKADEEQQIGDEVERNDAVQKDLEQGRSEGGGDEEAEEEEGNGKQKRERKITRKSLKKRFDKLIGVPVMVSESSPEDDMENTAPKRRRTVSSGESDFDDDETQPTDISLMRLRDTFTTPNAGPSSSSSSSSSTMSRLVTDLRGASGKPVLHPNNIEWFDNSSVARAVTAAFRSYIVAPWTGISEVPDEVIERWWLHFRENYSWDPEYAELVKKTFIQVAAHRLKNNMSVEGIKLVNNPDHKSKFLTDAVAQQLREKRLSPAFVEKSNKLRGNRFGRDGQASKSTHGSCATSHLVKKMAAKNNGILPPPHEVYLHLHTRKDKSYIDEKARKKMEEFEARKTANPSISDADAFYQAAGGWTKFGNIPGMGNASQMYYDMPHPQPSRANCSGYVPSQNVQMQDRLKSTEDRLASAQQQLLELQHKIASLVGNFEVVNALLHSKKSFERSDSR